MTLPTGSLSHSTASSSYSETVAALHERPTSRLVVKSSGPEDERASNSSEDDDEVDGELSRAEQLRNWVRRLRRTFGTSFLLLVSTVYAVQGFTSFRSLAVNYFFKDNLQLQPADAQSLLTVMMVPWSTKPLYGIISDSFPLFGYHRKSYMILCSSMGTIASLTLAVPNLVTTPTGAVLMLTLNSLSTAVIDVVIDARVVEMSRLDPKNGAGDLQSVSWVSLSVGGILGSFLSGPATHNLGVRGVFCLSAVGSISPGYSQVFFYFTTEVLHFTPEFLGTISAFGYIFLMAGTMLYNTCFKDMSFRRIFFIAQLSLAVVSLLDAVLVTRLNLSIGIPDKAFVLGDAVLSDIISRLKTMPVLVLCAKLCPKGIEGTLFALLMSISNFSYSVSESWGAIVCGWLGIAKDEYNMLWLAIVLCSILKLAPIAFLFLIPAKDPQEYVDGLDLSLPVHGTATKDSFHESEGIEVEDENLGLILTAKDCSPMEEIQLKERQ
ncbi:Folate-Biopterin transporter (FBT) family [Phytophthora cinnamomi]|uniref:Folate-Biopterin transporter (FBT) family n=1 Tax=Phytophthora cinnamomi TaxID=4785 RepID=UPI00355A4F5A|nr:Folate-Biopterin transporter (FBT) family [Phytophthora cinnamomi]